MKVTPKMRKEIERACRAGQVRTAIARRYGIGRSYVSLIAKRAGLVRAPKPRRLKPNMKAAQLRRMVWMQNIVFAAAPMIPPSRPDCFEEEDRAHA